MESNNQVVPIAQSCIKAAEEIYSIVTHEGGAVVNIPVEKLQTLQNDGQRLSKFSKEQEGLFKKKKTEQQLKFKSLTREKEKHELEKNRQQVNLRSLQSRKDGLLQEKIFYQSSLDNARSALSSATSGLHRAEEHLKQSKRRISGKKKHGGIFGAAIGFAVAGPVGAAVGAGLGVAGSSLINELEGKVDEARRNIDRYQREVSIAEANCHSAESSLQGMQPQIDSCQRSINDCETSIKRCTDDSEKVHEEIGSVRQSLVFIIEAIRLWSIFENLSQNATEQTRQFEEILQIVQSTQRYDFIGSDGARSKANSFLEAWNDLFAEHNVPPVFSTGAPSDPEALT